MTARLGANKEKKISFVPSSVSQTQTERKPHRDQKENKFESAFILDRSHVDIALQAAFSTIDGDYFSNFTGDLFKALAFDIWEKTYTALMTRNFSALKEK